MSYITIYLQWGTCTKCLLRIRGPLGVRGLGPGLNGPVVDLPPMDGVSSIQVFLDF